MPLEETGVVDIAANTPDGKLSLVITDSGITTDKNERLNLLKAKLATYLRYIHSSDFTESHPNTSLRDVQIKVVCASAPSEDMKGITSISHPDHADMVFPVLFELFCPGSRSEKEPPSKGASNTQDESEFNKRVKRLKAIRMAPHPERSRFFSVEGNRIKVNDLPNFDENDFEDEMSKLKRDLMAAGRRRPLLVVSISFFISLALATSIHWSLWGVLVIGCLFAAALRKQQMKNNTTTWNDAERVIRKGSKNKVG